MRLYSRNVIREYGIFDGRQRPRQRRHPRRRLAVPGKYGHKWAKWVRRVQLIADER